MKVATRILVPVDFSDTSMKALDYALALQPSTGRELVVVNVIDPLLFVITADPYGTPLDTGEMLGEQRRHARAQLAKICDSVQKRGVKAKTVLATGSPQPAIVDTAKKVKADLIVMGTHGRSGLSRFLLGSVAEKVVRTAPCSVLLVRGDENGAKGRRKARSKKRAT